MPGKYHGQRSLIGYSPWGHKESHMTERLHFHLGGSLIFSAKTEKSWANWDELDTQVSAYSTCSINAGWENNLCSKNSDFQPPDCEKLSFYYCKPPSWWLCSPSKLAQVQRLYRVTDLIVNRKQLRVTPCGLLSQKGQEALRVPPGLILISALVRSVGLFWPFTQHIF